MRRQAFGKEDIERRQLRIALDQRRPGAGTFDEALEQGPDRGGDGRVVRIDQQAFAERCIRPVAGQMDFGHAFGGKRIDIAFGRGAEIAGADVDVVDVEQQRAARAPRQLGEKIDLVPVVALQREIVRRVLDGDGAAKRGLHPVDVVAQPAQRLVAARKGQQVGKVDPVLPRPGQVLRYQRRLDAPGERGQAGQRALVGRVGPGERQRNPMQRERMLGAQGFKPAQAGTAVDPMVFGVDLEPQARGPAGQCFAVMLGLEPEACRECGHAQRRTRFRP